MNAPVFTVSEINRHVKAMFDSELMMQSIFISGEISNFSNHYATGHMYFTLKDDKSAIKAVMFNRAAMKLRFVPENGMKVIVLGRVSVFERDGVYQIYVEQMQPDGAGALALAFEQLKKKLEKEGLFSPEHKKAIPRFPKRIGVITSPTGAAVQDIFNVISRRYPLAEIVFQPVSVQGDTAAEEIRNAVRRFSRCKGADVLIVGRGGGSIEDLWSFNDEALAREIFNCTIPVISAVGHETDFTICDFVSDLRAPTPSAAAELATPDINNLYLETASLTDKLYKSYKYYIDREQSKLSLLLSQRAFNNAEHFFDNEKLQLMNFENRLKQSMNGRLQKEAVRYSKNVTSLESLNPLSVLLRGFAFVSDENQVIDSAKKLHIGQQINISFADSAAFCEVLSVEDKKK
ncbi:MAG: exodeoxyribonuclease VII large subunit [Clostridia bacterium]|nr:exodeoxyribonuclease VII large subunit [Clostridia bacterium]